MEKAAGVDKKIRKLNLIINKQKEELLRLSESEKLLNTVLDLVAGIHWWKDKDGVYGGCNDAMVTELGLKTKEDIIGKTDYELPWSEHADVLVHNDQEVMRTGNIQKGKEELIRINDNTVHTFIVAKAPLYDEEGQIIGTVGNSINITKQKKQEQELREAKEKAEEANLIKAEFMRNMEHDIRTPFSGVWGIANYLWERETDLQKKEYLGDITLCAKELLDYCNGILDFSKIESGMFAVIDKKFILKELIDRAITIELPAAKHKRLLLKKDYDTKIPTVLIGDSYRLYRVLINLLSNAIKFTEDGSIELKVALIKKTTKMTLVRFTIKDTGIGVPDDKQEYIFEKFSRLSPSNRGFYKGIGLGLRVVKQFMHEMGGEIDLISGIGKGTQFICTIPFKPPLTNDFIEK